MTPVTRLTASKPINRLKTVRPVVTRLWNGNAPMTAVGLLMLAALAASLIGLWLDPSTISGAPTWLKPAKFAASTAIYSLTLAWVFTYLPGWTWTRRIVGWTTALVLVLEVAIIDLQAWRGTTSHFNVGTVFDLTLFGIMGLAIVVQTLASIAVAVALWRQTFTDRAIGWALRLGMAITIVGASSGGLMTRPTEAQLTEVRTTRHMTLSGAHTVGAPDGGPGLPGTGWSLQHGDLRVPHFLGLHALQALPIILLALGRRRPEAKLVRLIVIAAASYAGLFAVLLWQALRGQSIVNPDASMLTMLALWIALTVFAGWITTRRRDPVSAHAILT